VDRGERKQSVVDDNKYIFKSDLLKFFGNTHVKDINFRMLSDYVEHLKTRGKKPVSSKTVKNHFITLSKILNHAIQLDYMDKMPKFPRIVQQESLREWFNDRRYQVLLKSIDTMISEKMKVRFIPVTLELKLLTQFMATSFLRPGDLKDLRHKHIQHATKENINYLRILAMSKVRPLCSAINESRQSIPSPSRCGIINP
jgi:hypothetical protein